MIKELLHLHVQVKYKHMIRELLHVQVKYKHMIGALLHVGVKYQQYDLDITACTNKM